jgi:hypothetical protein
MLYKTEMKHYSLPFWTETNEMLKSIVLNED